MINRDEQQFLEDILEACIAIEGFVAGYDFQKFCDDDRTGSAVLRKLEVVGEAAKHIGEEMRKDYPNVPWKAVAGMRDRLIHAYFDIDYELVWETAIVKVPELSREVRLVLSDLEQKNL